MRAGLVVVVHYRMIRRDGVGKLLWLRKFVWLSVDFSTAVRALGLAPTTYGTCRIFWKMNVNVVLRIGRRLTKSNF